MTDIEVKDIFSSHKLDETQTKTYEIIEANFTELAIMLNQRLPNGPGKTVAIRKLVEAKMQANLCNSLEGRF